MASSRLRLKALYDPPTIYKRVPRLPTKKKKKKKKKTQNHTKNLKNCRMIIVGTRFEAQTQNVKGYWPSEPGQ